MTSEGVVSGSPRVVGTYRAELGECPVWDAESGTLFWLDILGQRVLKTEPASGETEFTSLETRINCIAQTDGGGWIAAGGTSVFDLAETDGLTPRCSLDGDAKGRFNDGKCDAKGRLWIGTATASRQPECAIYSVEDRAAPRLVIPGMAMSNGIGWSPDGQVIYFVDSSARCLYSADFDIETGTVGDQRRFFETPEGQVPDGLCVDDTGHVWLAIWGGSAVVRLTPEGREVERVALPTPRVSSCAFGGTERKTLFVTTAMEGASEEEREADPMMGALFAVEIGVHGLEPNRFRADA